jgi:hypothetical protein
MSRQCICTHYHTCNMVYQHRFTVALCFLGISPQISPYCEPVSVGPKLISTAHVQNWGSDILYQMIKISSLPRMEPKAVFPCS